MNVQNLINEINALEGFDPVRIAAGSAFDNAGATVGPQNFMTSVSEEYANCFINGIYGMLADPSDYGIGQDVITWFHSRNIKG